MVSRVFRGPREDARCLLAAGSEKRGAALQTKQPVQSKLNDLMNPAAGNVGGAENESLPHVQDEEKKRKHVR